MYHFKNDFQRHSWEYTGEVETMAWPRAGIRCQICGEERLVAVSLNSPGLKWGCYRTAFRDQLKRGDMIVVSYEYGGRLDRFEAYAPDSSGDLITSNLGGGRYRVKADAWKRQP
jgi:hypothetical protein